MDETTLRRLLEEVRTGRRTADDVVAELASLPFRDLGFARIDHHRPLRVGHPEAVYGPGKTPDQVARIVAELLGGGTDPVIATRLDDRQVAAARAVATPDLAAGGTMVWRPTPPGNHRVVVLTAGTADLPVATECDLTLRALGIVPETVTDVGVAGLHRLLASVEVLRDAEVVIVVAGMEGALASVVGGLTPAPVVAVPTSVGYGAGLQGVTALLGMLASCAAGLTVVGIDNGFGAAMAAGRILRTRHG